MCNIDEYIGRVLGLSVKEQANIGHSPVQRFLLEQYSIRPVRISGADFIVVSPVPDLDLSLRQLRKQLSLLEDAYGCPAVLELSAVDAQRRRAFIQNKQAFVVPGKQLYIPQLAMNLREYPERREGSAPFRPITQMTFLSMLYSKEASFSISEMAERLGVSRMGISRAGQELEQAGLVTRDGTHNRFRYVRAGALQDLFNKAHPRLSSPVKVQRREQHDPTGCIAGLDALASYTMLASPNQRIIAVGPLAKRQPPHPVSPVEEEVMLQIWQYDPDTLAYDGVIDPLSLVLSLGREMEDSRVSAAADELLERVWEGDFERN